MSRIGKMPVAVPSGVTVKISGRNVSVKGPKGELSQDIVGNLDIKQEDNEIKLIALDDQTQTGAYHGLMRSLVHNMVVGVTEGFQKKLNIVGVGYRGEAKGNSLILNVGYSNPVDFKLPEGISGTISKEGVIEINGIDKQLVGDVAAKIRSVRPPDAYKGKGIRYEDEVVRLKPGKSASKG